MYPSLVGNREFLAMMLIIGTSLPRVWKRKYNSYHNMKRMSVINHRICHTISKQYMYTIVTVIGYTHRYAHLLQVVLKQ